MAGLVLGFDEEAPETELELPLVSRTPLSRVRVVSPLELLAGPLDTPERLGAELSELLVGTRPLGLVGELGALLLVGVVGPVGVALS